MNELPYNISWPDNRKFAFTVFDDTDLSTLENTSEIYRFLFDLGIKITKSVWMLSGEKNVPNSGMTCEDPQYLKWILSLKEQGFEIGWHLASYTTSNRQTTINALDKFKDVFGEYPKAMANHSQNLENIYWGSAKLSNPLIKLIYNLATRFKNHGRFKGHVRDSELFWGDICKSRIRYCRNLQFRDINTLKICPFIPYHDSERKYVNLWFASADGANLNSYNSLLSEHNQDRLESEGGACIVYTHLGAGFYQDKQLNTKFRSLMERLAEKAGWFVPVTELLDYLGKCQGRTHEITAPERSRLEYRWLKEKLIHGKS
ncbi:MAG: hypothetical protein GF404_02595 [candidate division Zixibacteria bacterium]|nr:hypothetical protein [candidate division Zixibacteria bacterium]